LLEECRVMSRNNEKKLGGGTYMSLPLGGAVMGLRVDSWERGKDENRCIFWPNPFVMPSVCEREQAAG